LALVVTADFRRCRGGESRTYSVCPVRIQNQLGHWIAGDSRPSKQGKRNEALEAESGGTSIARGIKLDDALLAVVDDNSASGCCIYERESAASRGVGPLWDEGWRRTIRLGSGSPIVTMVQPGESLMRYEAIRGPAWIRLVESEGSDHLQNYLQRCG
jgi:hypothetical protein